MDYNELWTIMTQVPSRVIVDYNELWTITDCGLYRLVAFSSVIANCITDKGDIVICLQYRTLGQATLRHVGSQRKHVPTWYCSNKPLNLL